MSFVCEITCFHVILSQLFTCVENSETRIKTDDDTASSSCSGSLNKDCGRILTKNGANNVIGSTNTGSIHNLVDQKEPHLLEGATDDCEYFLSFFAIKMSFNELVDKIWL